MGLFEKIFGGGSRNPAIKGYFETLTAYNPVFYTRSGGIYEAMETRAAIHAIATHCSKLKPHVNGPQSARLDRRLQLQMNPWQNTQQFLYRAATILEVDNACFIAPLVAENGKTVGAFPLVPSSCELVENAAGELFLRYRFGNGKHIAIEYSRCGVLLKMQYKNDFFPESNAPLLPTLDLIDVENQGIENGIKQSAAIRFLAKLGSSLRDEDIEKERQRFRKTNLSAENNGGVLLIDTKYADVKQLESKPFVVDADQMKLIKDNVHDYFGTNDKILRNEWDEAVWSAFYEGKVEVFALQMHLALTSMFFSEREQALGNDITFSANRLQFAKIEDKVNTIKELFDRMMLSPDEGREILQMEPLPDGLGQKYYIRGEYLSEQEREAIKAAKAGKEKQE